VVARLTTIRSGVLLSETSAAGSQAVDPSGRWASRTRIQPGRVAMTGSTDGRPYQVAGTVPAARVPGAEYLGVVVRTVASSVLSGSPAGWRAGAGAAGGRAGGAADGWPVASAALPPDESTRPIEVASTAAAVMATALVVLIAGNSRFASVVLRRPGGTNSPPHY
jgi:hypothetical protein